MIYRGVGFGCMVVWVVFGRGWGLGYGEWRVGRIGCVGTRSVLGRGWFYLMVAVVADKAKLDWIGRNLTIMPKRGGLMRLGPNVGQLMFHMSMQEQRCRGLPVRICLLKPRQVGWTTWSAAEGFADVYCKATYNEMVVSHDADSTDEVFSMTRLFHEELPGAKRGLRNTNRKELIYKAPHWSKVVAQTSGKIGVGRSFRCHYLHCSEVAYWQNAANQLTGLYQIVPKDAGTAVILESTANGQGGAFYDTFHEGRDRLKRGHYDGFLSVFFPWYRFPEYAIEPREAYVPSAEERSLGDRFGLSLAQLYWRKLKIEELNYDVGRFMQEYPATWQEAFQVSGNPIFSPACIATQESHAKDGGFRKVLFDETSGVPSMVDVEGESNYWLISELPQQGQDYALGIDTMEGRLSDPNNPRSKLDWDGAMMLCRNTGRYVAMYHGRGDQRELAKQTFRCARYYNEAYVAPEIPAAMVLLGYFKERGYPNLYNRQIHEDRMAETDSEVLGWRTTAISRKWLVEDFVVLAGSGEVWVVFPDVIQEMRTFVRDKTGKPIHLDAEHDDLLFAAMIAYQVHKRCPMSAHAYGPSHTGEEPQRRRREVDLAYAGAIDPGLEDEEEDDDSYWETHSW